MGTLRYDARSRRPANSDCLIRPPPSSATDSGVPAVPVPNGRQTTAPNRWRVNPVPLPTSEAGSCDAHESLVSVQRSAGSDERTGWQGGSSSRVTPYSWWKPAKGAPELLWRFLREPGARADAVATESKEGQSTTYLRYVEGPNYSVAHFCQSSKEKKRRASMSVWPLSPIDPISVLKRTSTNKKR
jgi:hypothetical protein